MANTGEVACGDGGGVSGDCRMPQHTGTLSHPHGTHHLQNLEGETCYLAGNHNVGGNRATWKMVRQQLQRPGLAHMHHDVADVLGLG